MVVAHQLRISLAFDDLLSGPLLLGEELPTALFDDDAFHTPDLENPACGGL
jgi:hypothetical protein